MAGSHYLLALQRAAGNKAVSSVVAAEPGMEGCVPYATKEEAEQAETDLRENFLPKAKLWFGSEVHDLWKDYLDGGTAKRRFEGSDNFFVKKFANSRQIEASRQEVMAAVEAALSARGIDEGELANGPLTLAVRDLGLPSVDIAIDFPNPFEVVGNVAGGRGSGDKQPDRRYISSGTVTIFPSAEGIYWVKLDAKMTVQETLDLCPGNAGAAGLEGRYTLPMKRLEASGRAGDVPFDVVFDLPFRQPELMRIPARKSARPDAGTP